MSIKVGLSSGLEDNGRLLWTIPAGATITAKLLVNPEHVIEAELCHLVFNGVEHIWAYTGKGDPCAILGVEPRYSVIVPVIARIGSTKTHRNIRFPKSIGRQFHSLGSEVAGTVVEISRVDSGGFARYTIQPTGKRATLDGFNSEQWVADTLSQIFVEDENYSVESWLLDLGIPLDGSMTFGWKKVKSGGVAGEEAW